LLFLITFLLNVFQTFNFDLFKISHIKSAVGSRSIESIVGGTLLILKVCYHVEIPKPGWTLKTTILLLWNRALHLHRRSAASWNSVHWTR